MYYEKPPTAKTVLCRAVVEVACVAVLAYPLLHIYVFLRDNVEAAHRGFFCDDESLRHPYVQEKVRYKSSSG
jgi:hypothetical protein